MKLAAVDFETHVIGTYPDDAPQPVGVAILVAGRRPEYLSWGHPSGNNSTSECAAARLGDLYSRFEIVGHNIGFDMEVARRHLGLEYPARFHDSQLLAFLADPGANSLALKETADRVLGLLPAERDELRDLIISRVPEAARRPSRWAAHICEMPGDLVAPYAIGDVERTLALFETLHPKIIEDGMEPAYQRELAQIPILAQMTRAGIPIARNRLAAAIPRWETDLAEAEDALRYELGAPALDIRSPKQLGDVLTDAGWELPLTPKANRSVSREALLLTITDEKLRGLFVRQIQLNTNLRFARLLLELSGADGRIHCGWNSAPNGQGGARTGRTISNHPNLQGAPASMQEFIVPEPGAILLTRDYSQQELRVLAHYEQKTIKEAYLADSHTDFHSVIGAGASQILGHELPRRDVKIVVFSTLYGAGIRRLASQLGCPYEEARTIRNAVFRAAPGVEVVKRRMERVRWFETWGGRKYRADRNAAYKNLNYLIQGSAADLTKTATVRAAGANLDLRLSIHDAFVVMSEPGQRLRRDMALLKEAMDVEFSVPLLSEGKWSERNLGENVLREYRD